MIPSNWLFRDLDQDYGIDGEIEVFGANSEATGQKFLVQLKATDQKKIRKALRLAISYGHGDYYQRLALPVLIAIYHAPSRRLYWCWFHSLDPFDGHKGKSKVSFSLPEDQFWKEDAASQIEMDLGEYVNLCSPVIRKPVLFEVRAPVQFLGFSRFDLVSKMRELCVEQSLVSVATSRSAQPTSPNAIELSQDRIAVRTACGHGFSLHLKAGYEDGWSLESLSHDLILAVGLALHYHGHSTTAAGLVLAAVERSRLAGAHAEVVQVVCTCLEAAGKIPAALEVAERMLSAPNEIDVAVSYVHAFLESELLNATREGNSSTETLFRIGDRLRALGHLELAGTTYYNTANLARRNGQQRVAVRGYRLARELFPEYGQRAYWWQELGGSLFLAGRYRAAELAYRQALELEGDRRTAFLHADALLFAGRYSEALKEFQEQLNCGCDEAEVEWWLKARVLELLVIDRGTHFQVRRSRAAQEAMPKAEPAAVAQIVEAAEKVLRLDALNATAWYNLAHGMVESGEQEASFPCYLMAALLNPGDVEAWSNAAGTALNGQEVLLASAVLAAGFRANGEAFVRHWRGRWPAESDAQRELVEKACEQIVQGAPGRGHHRVIRMHDLDGAWDELRFQKRTDGGYTLRLSKPSGAEAK